MKIQVDSGKCVAAGLCVMAEETVFDQDPETGTVVLLTDEPASEVEESVREAASICPALAISLHEQAG